jgi:competence protein ComEA
MDATQPPTAVQRSAPAARLGALGLVPPAAGWVPEQAALAEPEPPPPMPPPPSPRTARDVELQAPGHSGGDGTTGSGSDRPMTLLQGAIANRLPLWASGPVERATPGALVAGAVAVVTLLLAGVLLLHRHPSGGGSFTAASTYPVAQSTTDPVGTQAGSVTGDATSIVVDVGGRVRRPGLVTLPAGARVADAITAAGGPLRRHELDRIDLAARVTDGQLLLVGVAASAPDGTITDPSGGQPSAPVSLSDATLEQLETLPGVGPVIAQKIIDWRTAHGGFTTVEQLQQVPGIGPAHFAEISPLVTP